MRVQLMMRAKSGGYCTIPVDMTTGKINPYAILHEVGLTPEQVLELVEDYKQLPTFPVN